MLQLSHSRTFFSRFPISVLFSGLGQCSLCGILQLICILWEWYLWTFSLAQTIMQLLVAWTLNSLLFDFNFCFKSNIHSFLSIVRQSRMTFLLLFSYLTVIYFPSFLKHKSIKENFLQAFVMCFVFSGVRESERERVSVWKFSSQKVFILQASPLNTTREEKNKEIWNEKNNE